jgi:hypothetical protein
MKRVMVAIAALGALAFAGNAQAALQVVPASDNPAGDGFYAEAPSGWKIDNCTATMDLDAGTENADTVPAEMQSGWDQGEAYFLMAAAPDQVVAGDYVNTLSATCQLYRRVTTHHYERVWRWHTNYRSGVDTSSRSKSGQGYFRGGYETSGGLTLDSWGGDLVATYRVGVPSNARRISRSISGYRSFLDMGGGSISRWWSGNTATVRVTNYRAYVVDHVKVRYQAPKRVRFTDTRIDRSMQSGTTTGSWIVL